MLIEGKIIFVELFKEIPDTIIVQNFHLVVLL